MREIDYQFGKPGESIPVVDAADLKVMWANRQGGYGDAAYKSLFNPTSDTMALGYRCQLLNSVESLWVGGEPSQDAFEAAASMELKYPQLGVVQQGLLFSVDKLIQEVLIWRFKVENKVG